MGAPWGTPPPSQKACIAPILCPPNSLPSTYCSPGTSPMSCRRTRSSLALKWGTRWSRCIRSPITCMGEGGGGKESGTVSRGVPVPPNPSR